MLTASGSWSLALTGMEQILADTTAFRDRSGATTSDKAKERIHYGLAKLAELGTNERPCAVLAHGGGGALAIGAGDAIVMGSNGQIVVVLVDNAKYRNHEKQSYLDFCNWVGQIFDGVGDLAGVDYESNTKVYWAFNGGETLIEPTRTGLDMRSSEDYWIAAFAWNHRVE